MNQGKVLEETTLSQSQVEVVEMGGLDLEFPKHGVSVGGQRRLNSTGKHLSPKKRMVAY